MSRDTSADASRAPAAEPVPKQRADPASILLPLAVVAVAVVAVTAAFIGKRPDDTPQAQPAASTPPPPQAVVQAPPLVVTAPALMGASPASAAHRQGSVRQGATSAMGIAPACEECGVVESVRAAKPGDSFEMHIRMDDGSLRTVEQRGALAAGTRVVVQGGSVRLPG